MKRISIVFEEGDAVADGVSFNVFLEGLPDARKKAIDMMSYDEQLEKLSTAEFWALRCFQITIAAVAKSGALRTVQKRSGSA